MQVSGRWLPARASPVLHFGAFAPPERAVLHRVLEKRLEQSADADLARRLRDLPAKVIDPRWRVSNISAYLLSHVTSSSRVCISPLSSNESRRSRRAPRSDSRLARRFDDEARDGADVLKRKCGCRFARSRASSAAVRKLFGFEGAGLASRTAKGTITATAKAPARRGVEAPAAR